MVSTCQNEFGFIDKIDAKNQQEQPYCTSSIFRLLTLKISKVKFLLIQEKSEI